MLTQYEHMSRLCCFCHQA